MLSADVLKLVAGLAVAYVWELTACRPARPQLQLPLRNVLGLGACTTPPPSSNATAKSAALNTWPPVPVIPLPVASLLAGHHQDRDLVLFLWDSVFCVAVVLGVLLLFKFFGAVDLATSLWTDRVTARLNLRPHARLAVESAFKNLMWRFVENDVALLFGGLLVCLVYNASTTLGAGVTAALAVAVVGVVLLLLSRRYAALFGLVALIPAIGLAALQMLPADAQPSLGDALGTALNFALSAAAEPLNWDVLVLAAMMPCVSVPLCIAQDLIIPAKWRRFATVASWFVFGYLGVVGALVQKNVGVAASLVPLISDPHALLSVFLVGLVSLYPPILVGRVVMDKIRGPVSAVLGDSSWANSCSLVVCLFVKVVGDCYFQTVWWTDASNAVADDMLRTWRDDDGGGVASAEAMPIAAGWWWVLVMVVFVAANVAIPWFVASVYWRLVSKVPLLTGRVSVNKWNSSEWTPLPLRRNKVPKIVLYLRDLFTGDSNQGSANGKWFKKAIKVLRKSQEFLAGGEEGEDVFEFKVLLKGLDLVNTDRRTFDLGSTPVRLTVRDDSWAAWCQAWCRQLPCGQTTRRSPDLVSIEWSRIVLPGRSVARDHGHGRHHGPDVAVSAPGMLQASMGESKNDSQSDARAASPDSQREAQPVTATVRVSMQPVREVLLYFGESTKKQLNTTGGLFSSALHYLGRSDDGVVECLLGIFKDVYRNACVLPAVLKAQLHIDGFTFPIWSRPSAARQSCSLNESLRQFSPDPTDYLRAMTTCVRDIDEKTLGEGERGNVVRFKKLIAELVEDNQSQNVLGQLEHCLEIYEVADENGVADVLLRACRSRNLGAEMVDWLLSCLLTETETKGDRLLEAILKLALVTGVYWLPTVLPLIVGDGGDGNGAGVPLPSTTKEAEQGVVESEAEGKEVKD